MTSQISWPLIGGKHLRKIFGKSSENLRKVFRKMEASDWLLKIVGREIDDIISKNSSKRLISLTSWPHIDHIFRSQDSTSESVGKGSGIFDKARGKKEGRGRWGKAIKKRGGVGGGRTKKCGGWGGWVGDDVIEKIKKIK